MLHKGLLSINILKIIQNVIYSFENCTISFERNCIALPVFRVIRFPFE